MGLKYDQVTSAVECTSAYKLRAIYERKRSEVEEYRAAAHLVTVVLAIKRMGSVEDNLPGGMKVTQEVCYLLSELHKYCCVTAKRALAEPCSYSGK